MTPQKTSQDETTVPSETDSAGNSSGGTSIGHSPHGKPAHELGLRIASAVVLAALSLAALVASPWSFLVLVIVSATLLLWEWGTATRGSAKDITTVLQLLSVVLLAVCFSRHDHLLGVGLFAAVAAILAVYSYAKNSAHDATVAMAGLAYVALPAAALTWLRGDPDYGLTAVLFLLVVTWTTDTASYAGGRTFGGPKFAPKISPKKTWSGFAVGTTTPILIGVAFALYLGNSSVIALALVALALAFSCQMGDLLESAVKRNLGIKDMSQLIPGHGGFFDRIDSLLLAAVVAAMIALRDLASPGAGLLIW